MICEKCRGDLYNRFEICKDSKGFGKALCAKCMAAFIQQLAEWKDFELDEELKHWTKRP